MVTEMKRNLKMMGRRNESQSKCKILRYFIGSSESNHHVESCEMIGEA